MKNPITFGNSVLRHDKRCFHLAQAVVREGLTPEMCRVQLTTPGTKSAPHRGLDPARGRP